MTHSCFCYDAYTQGKKSQSHGMEQGGIHRIRVGVGDGDSWLNKCAHQHMSIPKSCKSGREGPVTSLFTLIP